MKKAVNSRNKAILTIAAIIILIVAVVFVIVIYHSSVFLDKNLDEGIFRHMENTLASEIHSFDKFTDINFRTLDSIAKYVGENGKEEFINTAAEMMAEANGYTVLGVSDTEGNAHCSTCKEDGNFYEIFPNADEVIKKGKKTVTMAGECGGTQFFGFAVPVYKDGEIIGAVYAGVGTEEIEEVLYSADNEERAIVFIVDRNGIVITGDKVFNEHRISDSVSDYFNGDAVVDDVLADLKEGKNGRFKAVHGEQLFSVYAPLGVEDYSVMMSVRVSMADKVILGNQKQHKTDIDRIDILMILLAVITLWVLIANVKRLMRASKEEIDKKQYKEDIYRNAILSDCLGYIEINLSDGLITEMSELKYNNNPLPDELRTDNGNQVSFKNLTKWISKNVCATDMDEFLMLNSVDYLISRYNKNELMTESFFHYRVHGNMICRAVYYMYENKFDGKIHAFSIIHDITEQYNSEQEIKKLIGEVRDAQIRSSTSQMQPHFLYNALASIREIILEDPQYASDLVYDFTTYLRACVRSMSNENLIPFTQELENIKAYVNIEKMRFGKKLKFETEIEESDFDIVPLSIQPLVENAIRHGIYQRGSTGGTVTVKTFKKKDEIFIQVIDDGVGFDHEKVVQEIRDGKRDSSGLDNIKFRLNKLLKAEVEIESELEKGTKVTVRTNVLGGGLMYASDYC